MKANLHRFAAYSFDHVVILGCHLVIYLQSEKEKGRALRAGLSTSRGEPGGGV
jgi:hypothetical protein